MSDKLSICKLDHECLNCECYNNSDKADKCKKCFKHEFKETKCRHMANNCKECIYFNEQWKDSI